jgi:DNA-binding transcriptional LysR family regulator
MQIESLRVFCDLAENHSFTKTAAMHSVTQSAVSQTISTLEREFHALLAERSRKNFRLTREGQLVYDYSKEMLRGYETLEERVLEARNATSGQIRLTTIHSVGLYNLPPCLGEFTKDRPDVGLHITYRRSAEVYDEVLAGLADLGIVAYPKRHPKLEVVPLCEERLVFICHPRHRLAGAKSIKLSALQDEKLACLSPEAPSGRALQRLLRAHKVTPQTEVDFDTIDALKRAVEIDEGVAIVPQATVLQAAANQSLAVVPLEGDYCRPLAIIHRKQMAISAGMNELIAMLKEHLNAAGGIQPRAHLATCGSTGTLISADSH